MVIPSTKSSSSFAFGFHATSNQHVKAVMVNIRRLRVLTPSSLNVKYVIIVPKSKRNMVRATEDDIVIHPYNQMNGPNGYYRESMAKLLIWNLVEYERVVYMDSDAIVVKPLHPLFFLPDVPLASPIAYWENENCFTGALLIAKPSATFEQVVVRSSINVCCDRSYQNDFFYCSNELIIIVRYISVRYNNLVLP